MQAFSDFRSLCTVTFGQKVDFLISNARYNSQLYGTKVNFVPASSFMQHKDKKYPHEFILIAEMSDLEFQSQMEASSAACCSFYVLCKMFFFYLEKAF